MQTTADNATVTSTSDGGSTNYTIQADSKQAIEQAIARIERAYHPLGYGTSFYPPKQTEDGRWECFGYRSNSCD